MNAVIIDVREKDEFEAEHIEGSIHLPLNAFPNEAPALFKSLSGTPIILMCRSGKRAAMAASQASGFSAGARLQVYDGGILAWKTQGRPTRTTRHHHFPIMRQVQLVAGSLVLLGAALAWWVNPAFILLAGFIGLGLTFAGTTGYCGLAMLLGRLPWNTTRPETRQEICNVSPSSESCEKHDSTST